MLAILARDIHAASSLETPNRCFCVSIAKNIWHLVELGTKANHPEFLLGVNSQEEIMRTLTLAIAAAGGIAMALPTISLSPAMAAPTKLAQVEIHTDHDRDRRERCHDVTVREKRGDETIVRHEQRCDR
jgi:hypothetical protein